MTKVDLILGESKSKVDLTLESKKTSMTFGESAPGTFDESTKAFSNPGEYSNRESKSKVSLSLESK